MLLFVFPTHAALGNELAQLPGIQPGHFSVDRFPNRELHAALQNTVAGEEVLILGTIAPPDEHLLSLLLLSHTLKKEGSQHITALLPYLAYARDEKLKAGYSQATALVGALLQASGVDEVITVDVHSPMVQQVFPLPIISLSPAVLLAQEIKQLSLRDASIVAPDEGARDRCLAVARAADMPEDIVVLTKRRTPEGVVHVNLTGNPRPQAVIVDDILDTGATLVSCCEQLQLRGVQAITIMVTHGLFTGEHWQHLWSLGVQHMCCTDTIPPRTEQPPERIQIVSILPLLSQYLQTR